MSVTREHTPEPFRLSGPLPTGTTVLEASAGTGKTFTIAALAARYLAEGVVDLDQLLVVTFGRSATNELRLRVRERLVSVERELMLAQTGQALSASADDLDRLLADGDQQTIAARHRHVARALADFDSATIATTHEFCLKMLDGLGILGARDPDAAVVEHLAELTRDVALDTYLRLFAERPVAPALDLDTAMRLAGEVVRFRDRRLVPGGGVLTDYPEAAERLAFASQVRTEVTRRKDRAGLFTYDDMLGRLSAALTHPVRGPLALRRLRRRFSIVLVDEFQDTDPVQWSIVRETFHGHTTVILIGDPKQSIYAFRGADVFSYLDAVTVGSRYTLGTNWRSDRALTDAVHALTGPAALGDEEIVVREVAAHHATRRMLAADAGLSAQTAPIRLRVLRHDPAQQRLASVKAIRPVVVQDLVADVCGLLESRARLTLDGTERPVDPSDIAVLVRTNATGEAVRDALNAANVPAVMLGATSVYACELATEWLTLLVALEQPRQGNVRKAALTCFVGWSFGRLARAGDDELIELSQQLRWWSTLVSTRGVAALLEAITTQTDLARRLLGEEGGERRLTDLRHIGQGLHAAMTTSHLGISALVAWLRHQMADAATSSVVTGTRRLETDAAAVTVLTVHRSKGLQFPVVYLPDAWDRYVSDVDDGWTLQLHERPLPEAEDSTGPRADCVIDVGGTSPPGRDQRLQQHRAEAAGEDLRLLYVALTRAQCQVVLWWASTKNTPASALHRFLYGSRQPGQEPPPRIEISGDPLELTHLGEGFSLEEAPHHAAQSPRWRATADPAPLLTSRSFTRTLDLDWRRTSYSALTATAHGTHPNDPGVGSEPELAPTDDEPDLAVERAEVSAPSGPLAHGPSSDALGDLPSPMQDLPRGVAFGSVVHAVLEHVDFRAADLDAEVASAADHHLHRTPVSGVSTDALTAALMSALRTPLGPLAQNLRLCDIERTDRLSELDFELPLAGGDQTVATVVLGSFVPLLRRHLPGADPLGGYADALDQPELAEQTLRGYLTGSVDAVLRVRDGSGEPRYLVVDYKTNWLGNLDSDQLNVSDYTPLTMGAAMTAAHYPLQALLYSVALHRLLRWRQPGYQPHRHLGGALYLFVRGMAGPDTPVVDGSPCGVFSWAPPAALVTELSDVLERGEP